MSNWISPPHTQLVGETVELHPLNPTEDAASFFAATHGDALRESVWQFMAYGPFADTAALATWMQGELVSAPDTLAYAIRWKHRTEVIGMVSLLAIAPAHGRAEIGHVVLSKAAQGTLANTETQFLLLQHLLGDQHYRRVEWKCDNTNEASKRTAVRLGFTHEGCFRQHMLRKGKNRDTTWFSLLDHEWPTASLALRKLLISPEERGTF